MSEIASGNENVQIQVASASVEIVDDGQLAAVGLRRLGAEDEVLRHGAQARVVFLESDEPQHAVVFCRVGGCLSKLSKLGDIDYQAEGGASFRSAYADVAVALPVVAECRCCRVESSVVDTRRRA